MLGRYTTGPGARREYTIATGERQCQNVMLSPSALLRVNSAKHLYAEGETLLCLVERPLRSAPGVLREGETAFRVTTFHPRNTSRNAATTFSMSFGVIQ